MADAATLDWIQAFDPEGLDDAHYRHAKRCLLDLLGVAAGASQTPLAPIAERFATTQHGGDRPLLFSTATASPTGVALHGAWLIDALDAHDGQVLTKGHVGVAALPGLLALPEADALSGKALLGWLTLGYEVATRAGIALHASACDYHTSGAWNALGVAAITARLLGLDGAQLREALGIAEFYGPRSQMMRCIDHPTMVKDGSGWGAMGGVSASLLARDGFTGAPAVTLTDDAVAPIWADLGERWYLFEQYFKAYPVCRWAQPAVEAVLELVDGSFEARDIARIEIDTFHEAKRLHTVHPADTEQAQYSLPWPVACALYFGTVDVHGITAALSDPAVRDIAARVETREDATFNARFPAERWARARLRLHDGRVLESEPCEARGNPTNPLDDAELIDKYRALAEPVLGERATRLREVVMNLETRPASDLLALLGAP